MGPFAQKRGFSHRRRFTFAVGGEKPVDRPKTVSGSRSPADLAIMGAARQPSSAGDSRAFPSMITFLLPPDRDHGLAVGLKVWRAHGKFGTVHQNDGGDHRGHLHLDVVEVATDDDVPASNPLANLPMSD